MQLSNRGEVTKLWQRNIERKLSALREARVAKNRRGGAPDLDPDEFDRVLATVPETVRVAHDKLPILPCVRCGDPGGKPGKRCNKPGRADGAAFGIEGEICLTCWHKLYGARRYRLRKEKEAMPRVERVPTCEVCGVDWKAHTPDCPRHDYRPGAEPDPGAEARRLEAGKASNRAVARRRHGPPRVEGASTCTGRDAGSKGALAGQVIEHMPYIRTEASEAEVLDAIVNRNGASHE